MEFSWLKENDKLCHLMAAALIVAITYIFCRTFGHPGAGLWIGDVLAILALVGKEVYDYYHPDKHFVEFRDIFAGLIGIFGMDLVILVQYLV